MGVAVWGWAGGHPVSKDPAMGAPAATCVGAGHTRGLEAVNNPPGRKKVPSSGLPWWSGG